MKVTVTKQVNTVEAKSISALPNGVYVSIDDSHVVIKVDSLLYFPYSETILALACLPDSCYLPATSITVTFKK